ncbi:alpha/beta fold hydrolase [Jiella sp. M17.18]|uniref:alpha/beta fold hydrolase n=1 Tax=Jiella sp. M17.18 TaxID=3234247 RepID=UPI0034DFE2F8
MTGIGLRNDPPPASKGKIERHVLAGSTGCPRISYLSAGSPEGVLVLFVHGSPGSADEWTSFLSDVPKGQYRIAIDRPGFGSSPTDEPVVALADQADAIGRIIDAHRAKSPVLVGYSYGGPVVLRLAADRGQTIAGILLIGSAADPDLETVHVLQTLFACRPFRRALPGHLAVANAELIALKGELETLSEKLPLLVSPVAIVHGSNDTLVPFGNVGYLRERLRNAPSLKLSVVEGADHFIPWSHRSRVEEALGWLLGSVRNSVCGRGIVGPKEIPHGPPQGTQHP